MRSAVSSLIQTLTDAWLGFSVRHPLIIIACTLVVTCLLGWVTISRIGINTDTFGMLSEHLDWRTADDAYRGAFPHEGDSLVVIVDGQTPELADGARDRLADALDRESAMFPIVFRAGGGEFFETNGLLYLSPDELDVLAERLAAVQPMLARLANDPSGVTLLRTLADAHEDENFDPAGLDEIMERVGHAINATIDNRFYRLSWQRMLEQDGSSDDAWSRRMLVVNPTIDYGELPPGATPIARLRAVASELELDPAHGVRVGLTGQLALKHDEFASLKTDAGVVTGAAMTLVCIVLFVGLRSLRLVIASAIVVLVGLVATAAFAAVTVGELNLISVAFAALYVGLGIDFPIHTGVRYLELRRQGEEHARAIRVAVAQIGPSLTMCALTTSIGFLAFVPTSFKGVSELGLIAAPGVFISLIVCMGLLPALLSVAPSGHVRPPARGGDRVARAFGESVVRRRGLILAGAALALVAASVLSPSIRFDSNRLNMRDPGTESAVLFGELLDDPTGEASKASVLAADEQNAEAIASRLRSLGVVDRVRTLRSFVPADQEEKLDRIDELAMVVGPSLSVRNREAAHPEEDWAQATARLSGLLAGGGGLAAALQRFEQVWRTSDAQARTLLAARLDVALVGSLPALLDRLDRLLGPNGVTMEDLPESLVRRWRTPDGRQRIDVVPAVSLMNNSERRAFVDDVQGIAPEATGAPVVTLRAGESVVAAFGQAVAIAIGVITIILLVIFRSVFRTLLVTVPLMLALAYTAGASVIAGVHFNFANVIAIPLILGIGVDGAIHMVHRATLAGQTCNPLMTGTARAVIVSSMTTVGGFGGLMLSSHPGTASLGLMLLMGVLLSMACTLVVLPALLAARVVLLNRGVVPRD